MGLNNDITLVRIFSGELYRATLIKTLLEDSGIHAYLENEFMGVIAPWRVEPGGVGAVKVTVSSRDVDQAKLVLQNFDRSNE